jgi:anti-sigma factor RsiW
MNAALQPCPERDMLLHGLADEELDAANALALEAHLQACAGCSAAIEAIARHKALLADKAARFQAPANLRARILESLPSEDSAAAQSPPALAWPAKAKRAPHRGARIAAAFSAMALAASLILFVNVWTYSPGLDQQLVSAHVRSLLAEHLTDVASSDQHTVKPWFLGKVDFAPPVVDLAKEDFPLFGGRLDYIGGRVAPSLVYKRRGHVINVFLWPESSMSVPSRTMDGYHVLPWTAGGFDFAAVSDLNWKELREFEDAFRNAMKS